MDIDDDLLLYSFEAVNVTIYEAYKIAPESMDLGEATVLKYGTYDPNGGELQLETIDKWQRRGNLQVSRRSYSISNTLSCTYNQGLNLRVTTLESPPYLTAHYGGHGTIEEPRMEGMFADIFHALQEKMNFTYDLGKPPDFEWGVVKSDEPGAWTGMVGQLQRRDVDIGTQNNMCKIYLILVIHSCDRFHCDPSQKCCNDFRRTHHSNL